MEGRAAKRSEMPSSVPEFNQNLLQINTTEMRKLQAERKLTLSGSLPVGVAADYAVILWCAQVSGARDRNHH